jgi:hypothetical protein
VAGTRDEAVKRHTPVHDYLAAHFTAAILGRHRTAGAS